MASRAVALLPFVAFAFAACIDDPPPATPANADLANAAPSTSASSSAAAPEAKLEISDVVVGTGEEAKTGDAVRVHYTGKLVDGTVFDSSVERGTPFAFILGEGKVIKGWELGVVGMRVGGKRKLRIPPRLGYGEAGSPPKIPPNSTLLFDVELLNVVR